MVLATVSLQPDHTLSRHSQKEMPEVSSAWTSVTSGFEPSGSRSRPAEVPATTVSSYYFVGHIKTT